jgi:thiol-disulfide isomerase/thioredoxin
MKNMKLVNILVTSVTVTFLSCSPKHNSFVIKGTFDGIADKTKIELIPAGTMKEEKAVAVTEIKNGVFTFRDTVPEPRLYYLKIGDGKGYLSIMVENSKIIIKGKPAVTMYDKDKFYQFDAVTISGSTSNDLFDKKMHFHKQLDSIYKVNNKLSEGIRRRLEDARDANNKVAMDSLSKTDEYKAMAERETSFFKIAEEDISNAVLSNKDSWWGPMLMINNMSYFTDQQREWYNQFPKEVQESYYGKIVRENLPRESWEGKQGPDFTAINEDGSKVTFYDLIKGHKYVILDFWASWCNPCRKEIPNLRNLYKEYKSKGFAIISVSIDKDANAWKASVKENQLMWQNFLDTDGSIADTYKVKSIPAIFLVDNSGKIILDNKRGEELALQLKNLMK